MSLALNGGEEGRWGGVGGGGVSVISYTDV